MILVSFLSFIHPVFMAEYLMDKIFTQRLILRPLSMADRAAIFSLRSNDEVNRYLGRKNYTTEEEAGKFITMILENCDKGESYYWGIVPREETGLIGTICIWNISQNRDSGDIGYELLPARQGAGIMQEALLAVIRYAFEDLHMRFLTAFTVPENLASCRLLSKTGFLRDDALLQSNMSEEIGFILRKSTE